MEYTKLGLKLALAESRSNLEAWEAKPWHSESSAWVAFWKGNIERLLAMS